MKFKIGFSKSKKKFPIFGWLIQLFQRTPFSHVYLRKNGEKTGEYVYQASGTMVNFMGIDNFLKLNEPIKEYELEIEDDLWYEILPNLIKYAGRDYSIKQIIAIALAECFEVSYKNIDGDYAFICSEIVVEILHEAKIVDKSEWNKIIDLITPKDIFNKLKELELHGKIKV